MAAAPSLNEIESCLRDRLARPLPGPDAQQRFAPHPPFPGWSPDLTPTGARRAAALILLYPGEHGVSLPLTVRRDDLPHHPGQVSLPGGAIGPGETASAAALREAHEEIGVQADNIRILGALSTLWVYVSNFVVQPFVGVLEARPRFRPHPGEVAALLEVPLAEFRDRARLKWARRDRGGVSIEYPYFDVAEHVVWGATAMMLGEFTCLFDDQHAPPPAQY